MTLSTHAVIAAAVTAPLAPFNPAIPFVAALASHYLSDAIPHWDYRLHSFVDKKEKREFVWNFRSRVFLKDLGRIAFDGFLGLGLVLLIVRPTTTHQLFYALAIPVGSMLPDFLQGLYYAKKITALRATQNFHDFFHTKIKLGPYPLVGVPFQAAIALFCAIIAL